MQRSEQPTIDVMPQARAFARAGQLASAFATARLGRLRARTVLSSRLAFDVEIGWIAFQLGQPLRGLVYANEAISFAVRLHDGAAEVKARAIRAWLLLELGRGIEAAEEAVRARNCSETIEDRESASWAFNVLGCVCWYSRQLGEAETYCRKAVLLAESLDDPVLVGWWLINLGGVHDQRGRDERESLYRTGEAETAKGLDLTRRAAVLLQDGADVWASAIAVLNIADIYVEAGDLDAAGCWLDTLATIPKVDGDRHRVQLLTVQGRLLLGRGHAERSLSVLHECLDLSERCGNHEGILLSLDSIAGAYEQLGRYADAYMVLRRRQRLVPTVVAERVQERARVAEVLLGLRHLENQIAISEQRLRVAEERSRLLDEDIRLDVLTGIGNRRRFDEALHSAAATARYAIAMIDIDDFKAINDRFTHSGGDAVLRHIASTLKQTSRPGDLAVRLGGEEFAIVFPDACAQDAARICERLRQTIMHKMQWSVGAPFRVTASFGVADNSEAADGPTVTRLADQRLYIAKRSGRNRVVTREPVSG